VDGIRRAAVDQRVRSVEDDYSAVARLRWRSLPRRRLARARELGGSAHRALGYGESTIGNFVVEALRARAEDARPDILSFTPWSIAVTGTVEDRLLRQVAIALNHPDASAADRSRAVMWEEWAAAPQCDGGIACPIPRLAAGAVLVADSAPSVRPLC
jgi:hypothetical protein